MGKRLIPVSATAVSNSANRKLGDVHATYASQATCPTSCTFRGSGCYAEYGLVGFETRQLNADAENRQLSALQIAGIEAAAISRLAPDGRALRLHVVGDCATDATARVVSSAADLFMQRGGGQAWTYTHGWRDVERASWGQVSVLASCETAEDVRAGHDRGYAAAVVLPEHGPAGRYDVDGVSIVECPQQTREDITCADCRLCQRADYLQDSRTVIGFVVHSGGTKKARAAIAARV